MMTYFRRGANGQVTEAVQKDPTSDTDREGAKVEGEASRDQPVTNGRRKCSLNLF